MTDEQRETFILDMQKAAGDLAVKMIDDAEVKLEKLLSHVPEDVESVKLAIPQMGLFVGLAATYENEEERKKTVTLTATYFHDTENFASQVGLARLVEDSLIS